MCGILEQAEIHKGQVKQTHTGDDQTGWRSEKVAALKGTGLSAQNRAYYTDKIRPVKPHTHKNLSLLIKNNRHYIQVHILAR